MKCLRLSAVAGALALVSLACLLAGCRIFSSCNDTDLRVATYNIRLLVGAPGSDDCWAERRMSVAETLRGLGVDVCGLQEVCPGQLADLQTALPDYTFVGDHRESDRKSGEASPVAYRTNRFDLEGSETFWLSETPEIPASKSWGTACTRVCTCLVLRDRLTGKRFCFANTHTDHISAEAREKGVRLILERLRSFGRGLPIVFTGDFNCNEDEAPVRVVTADLHNAFYASDTPAQGSWRTWNAWRWRDAEVLVAEALEQTPEVRNGAAFEKKCGGSRIDYIFVSSGVHVLNYETVNVTRPGEKRYPSDHFPVVATVRLPCEVWCAPDSPAPARYGASGRAGSAPGSGLPHANMW